MKDAIKKFRVTAILFLLALSAGCDRGDLYRNLTDNKLAYLKPGIVMNPLVITGTTSNSITLARPTFSPLSTAPTQVQAWIGHNGVISVSGSTVTGSLMGPADVSVGAWTITPLLTYTTYRIIVIARNADGFHVQQIVQSTAGIAPVLNPLMITGWTNASIDLAMPTYSTAGNPLPSAIAYIGVNGTMSWDPATKTVIGPVNGTADVTSGPCSFGGLLDFTTYRIIVVAQNSYGATTNYSVEEITQNTDGIGPVLNTLSINSFTTSSITVNIPTFVVAGNPAPTLTAYIGNFGTLSIAGTLVSGHFSSFPTPLGAPIVFPGLSPYSNYHIAVVAQNAWGASLVDITRMTAGIAPVLNPLSITGYSASSIQLAQPTHSVTGIPAQTVMAYIGVDGSIGETAGAITGTPLDSQNVTAGGASFLGLTPGTYRIIVISTNAAGYSVEQVTQSI